MGINVTRYRYIHTVAGGAFAGIGGATFSLAITPQWVDGLTQGAGWIAIALVIFAFWRPALCLVGAYFFGRLFGKRKMVPHLSPGKTWAGAVGALVGSAASAVAWLQFATPLFTPLNTQPWTPPFWIASAFYGLILGITGLIGDLCESLIKRDVGKKDSARLLPGFGGLLDLMDSVLYAGPVAYLLWKALPLVTWHVTRMS